MSEQTDRELLELAAKAACRVWHWDGDVLVLDDYGPGECSAWHPLTDDGDALRLAVQLRINIRPYHKSVEAGLGAGLRSVCCDANQESRYAATRRAVVRAAAAIGERMS